MRSNPYIKHQLINKKSSRNDKFLLVFIFFTLIIVCLANNYALSNQLNILINKFKDLSLKGGIFDLVDYVIPFLALPIVPIVSITLYELFISNYQITESFKSTSIGRVLYSEGRQMPDLWYFFIPKFESKFQFVFTLITLGTARLDNNLSNWFHNIYKSFLSFGDNHLVASFIVILSLLLIDLGSYWQHRLSHKHLILWDLHEFHHSATEMTILNKDRQTLLNPIGTIFLPFTVFLGLLINEYISLGFYFPLILFLLDNFIGQVFAYLGHSCLIIVYPKPISYFLMSPAYHLIHHSNNPKHYNCNFGEKYVFWDKIFNSFRNEENIKDITGYGVYQTQYNKFHPLYSYFILPITKISRRALKSLG